MAVTLYDDELEVLRKVIETNVPGHAFRADARDTDSRGKRLLGRLGMIIRDGRCVAKETKKPPADKIVTTETHRGRVIAVMTVPDGLFYYRILDNDGREVGIGMNVLSKEIAIVQAKHAIEGLDQDGSHNG